MKYELKIFFTALMFYTRIPCPKWVGHQAEYLNRATRYFPFIGWIVGLISAVIYLLGSYLFEPISGLLLSMTASVLSTGAFHEDGFADVCDGFGGGWKKEKILEIMKDSRVGTYGVVGLFLLMALKFSSLYQVLTVNAVRHFIVFAVFISAHALSRFVASTFIYTHTYVREIPDSKIKPVAQRGSIHNLLIGFLFAFVPLIVLSWSSNNPYLMLVVLPAYAIKMYLSSYFTKWIGGYTGDCLGATQQVSEVIIYLSFLLIWKFT